MPQLFTDNARAILMSSIGTGDTTLTVEVGKADRFPVANTSTWSTPLNWFKLVVIDSAGNREVMKVGTRAAGGNVMSNILRGQDGTTALAFTAGAIALVTVTSQDIQNTFAAIFQQMTLTNGAVGAGWRINAGILTLAQTDSAGNILADRFTFDQTNGLLTATDLSLTSDERLKSKWKGVARNFIARLADVKRGSYARKGAKRREVGVSAQSLAEVIPEAVHADASGQLSVSYGQAAMLAAIELAADNVQLRAALADLTQRVKMLERAK